MREDEGEVLSVSQLTRKIRGLLEDEIGAVWVEGEISNLRRQASGHQYFTLKDDGSQLSCVMFRGVAQRSAIGLADGVAVQLLGDISVYEPRGTYQMVVKQVKEKGKGSLQARFEALKTRLLDEGLFDSGRKRPIPKMPQVVALVTSPSGAAIRDMLNILGRRAPWLRVLVFPVRVQGQGAEHEIARAITLLNDAKKLGLPEPDTLVVGRGGGSLEDLWNFNEEEVARAIFQSRIPVISAVGHEIDFTISDFVADLRAPTPSAAAELLTPSGEELARHFDAVRNVITRSVQTVLMRESERLGWLGRGPLLHEPQRRFQEAEQAVDERETRLREGLLKEVRALEDGLSMRLQKMLRFHPDNVIAQMEHRLEMLQQRLRQYLHQRFERMTERLKNREDNLRLIGPQAVLTRGFSYTLDSRGRVLTSPSEVSKGDLIQTHLANGVLKSQVIEE